MNVKTKTWTPDPLVWGTGNTFFEIFLEPTCPFSVRAFSKLDDLLQLAGEDKLAIRIWLHSQPWHMFSGILCRAIIAASTTDQGKEAAKKVLAAIGANREAFEFDDHRAGPNLDTTPKQLIGRLEGASGVKLADAFQISNLEIVVKQHTKYARQNGIHVSPTVMVGGLVDNTISSGDSVEEWLKKLSIT